jgi:TolA-binding protein
MVRLIPMLIALILAMPLRADTVWIGSTSPGTPYQNIKITRIEAGKIYYEFGGNSINKELAQVRRIMVDAEPGFNAAEEAFVGAKLDDAVDGYQKTLRGSNKQFLKDWCANRLVEVGGKTGRVDAAVSAYIHLLQRDPAAAKSLRPDVTGGKPGYLDVAATELTGATSRSGINDEQKLALLNLLIEVQTVRGDQAAIQRASDQVDEILSKNPNDPAAATVVARRKLQTAQKLLTDREYQKAIAEIESNRAALTEPQHQADALFILAKAKLALAQVSKSQDELKDAGLAFMRVVANFKDLPGKPHVAESLYQTGVVYELLGEKETAASVYQQVTQQFLDDPAATAAREALDKLK